jgi:outer membrane protein TolC
MRKRTNRGPAARCRYSVVLALLVTSSAIVAQQAELSLDSCYALARRNLATVKQLDLLERSKSYSLSNASKAYLPQVSIAGQATYQSDVTQVPISLPNFSIPTLSKDQYRIYGEINQPLLDALVIKDQKSYIEASAVAEVKKVEAELYRVRERINEIFFGILFLDAQLQQVTLLEKDLQSALKKTDALLANGAGLKLNSDLVSAELIRIRQRQIEIRSTRAGFVQMLSLFLRQPIPENAPLKMPADLSPSLAVKRPELQLFESQRAALALQSRLVGAKALPRLSLFVQGGYGRPALNMLSNKFDTYYIGGLRLNWNLTGFYTQKRDRQLVGVASSVVDIQKETFLFNTSLQSTRQQSEISKLQKLMETDQEAIAIRERIRTTAHAQLENGTLSATDYLNYLNAEDQAKQNLIVHRTQLLMAQYALQTINGN